MSIFTDTPFNWLACPPVTKKQAYSVVRSAGSLLRSTQCTVGVGGKLFNLYRENISPFANESLIFTAFYDKVWLYL